MTRLSLLCALLCACGGRSAPPPPPSPSALPPDVKAVALPGSDPGGVYMDFIGFDAVTGRLWVPAGGTGKVDVVKGDAVTPIDGFATARVHHHGHTFVAGPSSVAFAEGYAWVGNRGDSSVCAFDVTSLAKAGCVKLSGMPDALQPVPSAHQLWVTTPHDDDTIVVLDVTHPEKPVIEASFSLGGVPECTAVDEGRGLFYTNLEDKDETVALDLHDHHVVSTWSSNCRGHGPRGLAVDPKDGFVLVACSDHVEALDPKTGAVRGTLDTGAGVDAITFVPATREVYAAAAKTGRLTVAGLDGEGGFIVKRRVDTPGARNATVAPDGTVYLTDSRLGRVLVVLPEKPAG